MRSGLCMLLVGWGCRTAPPVLVVGAGPAGLAAALEAAASRKVVVLEAASDPGGSARWAQAVTVLPLRAGTHPHLDSLRGDGVVWLEERGLAFEPAGAPAPRGFQSLQPEGGGARLVSVLVQEVARAGVELRTDCAVETLRHREEWTVTTQACGSFSSTEVVLATGGILGQDAARAEWVGAPTARLSPRTRAPTGLELTDGLQAARFDMGRLLWFDHVSPVEGVGRTLAAPPSAVALSETGERVAGALRGYGPDVGGAAWAIVSGTDRARTQLYDIDRGGLVSLDQHLSDGGGVQVESLAEAAAYTGIPEDKLTAALRRRTPRGPGPTPAGPHALVHLSRAPAKQLGGLQTDRSGRVLDRAGVPVPGLYAAGELTGFHGLHLGQVPVDSTMVVGAVVSGRVAGRAAARDASE